MRRLLMPLIAALIAVPALADAPVSIKVQLKDHQFVPARVEAPADTKFELVVENMDSTPAEFESHELNREKVVGGNKTITVKLGPLKAGEYKFFDEFHEKTAQGVLVVK